jgi:hypothetical protein
MDADGWMRLALVGLVLGFLGLLWERRGKPWCDRVSEATRYPRLTRIGLVTFLYGTVFVVGFALTYIAVLISTGAPPRIF